VCERERSAASFWQEPPDWRALEIVAGNLRFEYFVARTILHQDLDVEYEMLLSDLQESSPHQPALAPEERQRRIDVLEQWYQLRKQRAEDPATWVAPPQYEALQAEVEEWRAEYRRQRVTSQTPPILETERRYRA
jgi:hypothetical protein